MMIILWRLSKLQQKTIDLIKIISNVALSIIVLVALVYTISYRNDVQEAIGIKNPTGLLSIYENRTDTKCLCGDPRFGAVVYIPTPRNISNALVKNFDQSILDDISK